MKTEYALRVSLVVVILLMLGASLVMSQVARDLDHKLAASQSEVEDLQSQVEDLQGQVGDLKVLSQACGDEAESLRDTAYYINEALRSVLSGDVDGLLLNQQIAQGHLSDANIAHDSCNLGEGT